MTENKYYYGIECDSSNRFGSCSVGIMQNAMLFCSSIRTGGNPVLIFCLLGRERQDAD